MTARPKRTVRSKALRLACWNADGVRGRKLELEHFLSQHGVDICLLSETFLNSGQLCLPPQRQTDRGGGTAILVRCGIVQHSVPIPGLTHLEDTAIHVILAGTTVKILAAYHSFPPTDRSGPDRLFRREIADPDGRRPQRQTRGLELAAEHETGKPPTRLCRREHLSDIWTGHTHHQPIIDLRYPRCLGYRYGEGFPVPGVSDFVLCTKLGPPLGTHRQWVSLILSTPTGSP